MAARDLNATGVVPLPALRTHGCVALLDDDSDYVHTLDYILCFQQNYSTVPFTEPAALHAFLGQRISAFADEQRTLAEIWRAQLEASGTVAERALEFFACPDRLETPLVVVTDYAMPAETESRCARARSTAPWNECS